MNQPTNRAPQTVTALDSIEISADVESAIAQMQATGRDTGALSQSQRAGYVTALCRALRLNPLTNPVQFIKLNGKEVLYVTRTATDQLAAMHGLNRRTVRGPEVVDIGGQKVALCVVEVTLPSGRSETATATLPVTDPASLYMKLETKAKRRGTLAILGLGLLAEEEAESIPGAEREEPVQPAALAPHEEFAATLTTTPTIGVAAADLRRLSQRIHAVGASEIASEAFASWLDARGYVLTATDQRAVERGDWPADLLDVLDALAECVTGADVLRWWPSMAHVVDGLGAHAKTAKTVVARTYCAREGIATTQPARVFAAALAPKPPPTGSDSPRSASSDGATAEATSAPAESTAAAHASRERIASAGGVRAYLRAKGSRREIELAVRAHGRHVPGLAQIAAERLDALTPADHDGTRPTPETLRRDCERWASEGPLTRMLRAA